MSIVHNPVPGMRPLFVHNIHFNKMLFYLFINIVCEKKQKRGKSLP